jgi:hypothetical protein
VVVGVVVLRVVAVGSLRFLLSDSLLAGIKNSSSTPQRLSRRCKGWRQISYSWADTVSSGR